MPKAFLKRSAMEAIASEVAHHCNPDDSILTATEHFMATYNDTMAELIAHHGPGHFVPPGGWPGVAKHTLNCGLTFLLDGKDFYVDATAGIEPARGIYLP